MKKDTHRGFTLIEMIMSVAVFTVVSLIAAGALLALADANRKAQAFKSVVNNLNFAVESIARNLRTGSGYVSEGRGCSDPGLSGFTDKISFTSQDGDSVSYELSGTQIVRRTNGGTAVGMTAPEVLVSRFCFLVMGTIERDEEQPRALMLVGGFMEEKPKLRSRFDIQTFITQRLLDN